MVFDKVRENTKNLARTRQTYAEAANLAVNQTLVRSINTSIVALLPVGALLYVGVVSLGSGALKDLALALFVGMAAGAYSSIFIATPLVVQLKELEPGVQGRRRPRDAAPQARRRRPATPRCPTFTEDMAIEDEPGAATLERPDDDGADDDREPEETGVSAADADATLDSGRASGRPSRCRRRRPRSARSRQRKPRSQRGKR